MAQVLITAFEPYDRWDRNSSWLALVELTRDFSAPVQITTRLYPVDFDAARRRLESDLQRRFDFALHLGQRPGAASLQLEAIAVNVASLPQSPVEDHQPLVAGGPVAYRCALPLAEWAQRLRDAGIPTQVSYHAGTYLCNAMLYWTHYLAERHQWPTRAAFVHVPLDVSQSAGHEAEVASLPTAVVARGLKLILADLAPEASWEPAPR